MLEAARDAGVPPLRAGDAAPAAGGEGSVSGVAGRGSAQQRGPAAVSGSLIRDMRGGLDYRSPNRGERMRGTGPIADALSGPLPLLPRKRLGLQLRNAGRWMREELSAGVPQVRSADLAGARVFFSGEARRPVDGIRRSLLGPADDDVGAGEGRFHGFLDIVGNAVGLPAAAQRSDPAPHAIWINVLRARRNGCAIPVDMAHFEMMARDLAMDLRLRPFGLRQFSISA